MKIKNIINYEQPKYIYIPYDNETSLNIKEDKHVLVGDELTKYKGSTIESTISGTIIGTTNVFIDNTPVTSLIIENDYKDRKKELLKTRPYLEFGKIDIQKIIKETGLEKQNMDKIVLNINFIKNYDESDYLQIKEHGREILDTLDRIAYAYSSKEVYILLNKKDKETKKELYNYLGTYPNIKVVKKLNDHYEEYNITEVRKLNNILKLKAKTRHIYITLNDKGNVYLIKTKKYTILKELLSLLKIEHKKILNIKNEKIEELTVLNEKVRSVIIK